LGWVEGFQNFRYFSVEFWKAGGYDILDQVQVDSEIFVNEFVPHARNLLPGDGRMRSGQGSRYMFNGLANDFKVTDDGILGFPVFEEKLPSRTCVFLNVGEGIMNMEEINAIILHKGAALARIRSLR
jgi:hypothetical protein